MAINNVINNTFQGTQTNDNAAAGFVGEFVSSVIASANAVSVSNATATDITSISLTAGDWDVWGNITCTTVGTTQTTVFGWVSSSSATVPDKSVYCAINQAMLADDGVNAPGRRFSLAGTTTVYLTAYANMSSGNATICGGIYARRAR